MSNLVKLLSIARETSSEKRRELLREVTDLFFEQPEMRLGAAAENVDDILSAIVLDVEESVRAELAERFADSPVAPPGLISRLAHDAFAVARPVLERSQALGDDTLIEVASSDNQDGLCAIARRQTISEAVADIVVERGGSDAVSTLVRNEGAAISRHAMETIVDRAETDAALHEPLVERTDISPDLLQEMFVYVEDRLRERIEERGAEWPPEELAAAIEAAHARIASKPALDPARLDDARRYIQMKAMRRQLEPALLASLMEDGKTPEAIVGFATLTGLDETAAKRALTDPGVDGFAIACRAGGFSRDDFVRLALLRKTSGTAAPINADVVGDLYDTLPEAAVQRVIRFWNVRRSQAA